MSPRDRGLHRHAQAVLERELLRARKRLADLPDDGRSAVEETSARVVAAVANAVLDESRREPALARALTSIYGPEPAWEPKVFSWAAD